MRYFGFVLFFFPGVVFGQSFEDLDCGDFRSVVRAQGAFIAAKTITALVDSIPQQRDFHQLDRDGNGIACSNIKTVIFRQYSDSTWVEFRATPYRMECYGAGPFTMSDFIGQARTAVQDTVQYNGRGSSDGFLDKFECIYDLGVYQQHR